MQKPNVFIGSSSEEISVARAIKKELESDALITVWDEAPFKPGESILESLVKSLDGFDFAILVFRADDIVVSRKRKSPATRDNVLFEIGLFMGRLGRKRTFVFYDSSKPAKIISDLSGINLVSFADNAKNIAKAVRPGCDRIRAAMRKMLVPKQVWYAEYQLGSKLYKETLLFQQMKPAILGMKLYEEKGGKTNRYRLTGYSGKGFDWLEYHSSDGEGGGAIMLRHIGASTRAGLIVAGHCDTGVLRCYYNRWVDPEERKYKPKWLRKVGEVSAEQSE
jgi:hypothetical protein